jgi:hypothetical protein
MSWLIGRRRIPTGIATAGAVVMSFGAAASAQAAPLPPVNLTVWEGDGWRPTSWFRLRWENPPPVQGLAISAVHYQVRNAAGTIAVADTRISGAATEWEVVVPAPGAYKAEVWLEDIIGSQGPPAIATLRFDNLRPGPVEPLQPSGWIGRTAFPYIIRLGHPSGQAPPSGILGYAVSIDSVSEASPCAARDRCTADETDLQDGVEDDELSIRALPEGTNYVHAVAVSGTRMRSSTPGQTVLRVDLTDPVTVLSGVPSGWANAPVAVTATARDSGSGMTGGQSIAAFTAIQVDGGAPVVGEGASITETVIGEGIHAIAYYARDAAGNVNDGSTTNRIDNHPPSEATVRIDRSAPSVSFANAQDPNDPELIDVAVIDSLSGPDLSRGWIGVRRAGSGERFDPLPVDAVRGGLDARWDSDAYPSGRYEFRATGYDVAGNSLTVGDRANGEKMILTNPVKAPTALSAAFVSSAGTARCPRRAPDRCRRKGKRVEQSATDLLVRFGGSVIFTGKLIAPAGVSTAGMPVKIVERFVPGSDSTARVSAVTTEADGAFTIQLSPGPTREVIASFAGTRALGRSTAPSARLKVSSEVQLHVSAPVAKVGGRPVIFSGRVPAGGCSIPSNGKSVQLQFRLPGQPWTEFRTIQTDRRGNFSYPYRFSDDDSRGVRFQFRAYAPAQSDWPYEPGGSRPVAVRGA